MGPPLVRRGQAPLGRPWRGTGKRKQQRRCGSFRRKSTCRRWARRRPRRLLESARGTARWGRPPSGPGFTGFAPTDRAAGPSPRVQPPKTILIKPQELAGRGRRVQRRTITRWRRSSCKSRTLCQTLVSNSWIRWMRAAIFHLLAANAYAVIRRDGGRRPKLPRHVSRSIPDGRPPSLPKKVFKGPRLFPQP